MIAKAQEQLTALQESIKGATNDIKVESDSLKRPGTLSSEDDAFRVSVDVAKETSADPIMALNVISKLTPSSLPL